ncbi:MAG: hypothetical protein WA364_25390 [Candidatus Nitrosopolaris sp.]
MTVSQMTLTEMTESPQQQQHWLGEQVLNWSGVPVVHVRSTVFMEHPLHHPVKYLKMLYVIIYHIFKNRIKMERRDTEESYSSVLQ